MLPNTARQRFSLPAAGHELAAVRGEAGRSSGVCRALCFVSVLSVPRRFLRGSRTPLPNTSKPQPGPARIKLAAGGFADERWRPWLCPVSAAPVRGQAAGPGPSGVAALGHPRAQPRGSRALSRRRRETAGPGRARIPRGAETAPRGNRDTNPDGSGGSISWGIGTRIPTGAGLMARGWRPWILPLSAGPEPTGAQQCRWRLDHL